MTEHPEKKDAPKRPSKGGTENRTCNTSISQNRRPVNLDAAERNALSGAVQAHRDAIEKVLVPLAANGIRHDIKAHANRHERVAEWRRIYFDLVNGPAADGDGAAAMRAAIARAVPTGESAPGSKGGA